MAERKVPAEVREHGAAQEALHASLAAQDASGEANRLLDQSKHAERAEAMKRREDADKRAQEAEVARVKALLGDDPLDLLWVMSNRVDDRVVLFERDPRHPGGEAFVGGSAPAHVFRTPAVAGLLNDGVLVEVPEPKAGPKKPLTTAAAAVGLVPSAQPGQEVRLGRVPDQALWDEGAVEEIGRRQSEKPDRVGVPRGVIVPQAPGPERQTVRR